MSAVVDVVGVLAVVGAAVVFLASRFVGRRAGTGAVVVGGALQKGIDRARRRRR